MIDREAVIGWRSWDIGEDGFLTSVWRDDVWPIGTKMCGECDQNHRVAHGKCSCGIYASLSPEQAIDINLRYAAEDQPRVFGTVALWGKVIEATKGARGEFAYPQSLYVPTLRWREVELLSRYGVPIEVCNPYALGGKSWR